MEQNNLTGFRKATPEEVQAIQLEILQDVLDFCAKYKIRVYIAFGSLIGVVRHQGYIPWDDDIDIWMPRDDYERFIDCYNVEDKPYHVAELSNTPHHPYPFAKISHQKTRQFEELEGKAYNVGINVDLFPLNPLPDDVMQQQPILKKWDRLKALHRIKGISRSKKRQWYKNLIVRAANALLSYTDLETISRKMDALSAPYKQSPTKWVFSEEGRMVLEMAWFSETVMMPFEHLTVPIPKEYDAILTKIYGDYMQLPPEDKRISHHLYDAYVPK